MKNKRKITPVTSLKISLYRLEVLEKESEESEESEELKELEENLEESKTEYIHALLNVYRSKSGAGNLKEDNLSHSIKYIVKFKDDPIEMFDTLWFNPGLKMRLISAITHKEI